MNARRWQDLDPALPDLADALAEVMDGPTPSPRTSFDQG
jgi:hypothetical protein